MLENEYISLLRFQTTWLSRVAANLPHRVVTYFTGNQVGKTATIAFFMVMRAMSRYPIPKRNILYFECPKRTKDDPAPHGYYEITLGDTTLPWYEKGTYTYVSIPEDGKCEFCGAQLVQHQHPSRIFRMASENLPTEKETIAGDANMSAEIKNTQYPAIKKWLPPHLITKDITSRNPSMAISDVHEGMVYGGIKVKGGDIVFEFTSYNQSVQANAGVQRFAVWVDEECPIDFWQEMLPRMMSADADITMTLTPANKLSWAYDNLFEKAKLYVRTNAIVDFYKTEGKVVKQFEMTDSIQDVVVIQAATDDNPTLSKEAIDAIFNEMPDPDGTVIPTRRYGVFRQTSGRIFKDFNHNVHVIDPAKHDINSDVISTWVKGRSFDFHQANAHAIVWAAVSPFNEVFVYREWNPSPDAWVMDRICEEIASKSGTDRFVCDLIDPLANSKNTNTGKTSIEEMNKKFYEMRNTCSGAYWQPYNTKGTVGRDDIKMRLANSLKVCRPFNNEVVHDGLKKYIPTLWVFNRCTETARSLKHWRLESWANNRNLMTKERKETPAQRFSHFCTALEGLLKDKRFAPKKAQALQQRKYHYFKDVA